jgi:hypothetical protein
MERGRWGKIIVVELWHQTKADSSANENLLFKSNPVCGENNKTEGTLVYVTPGPSELV